MQLQDFPQKENHQTIAQLEDFTEKKNKFGQFDFTLKTQEQQVSIPLHKRISVIRECN